MIAGKKKEQEAMLKNAAKSNKNLEENEIFEQEERKLDEELDQATSSLTEAIGKGDMVGVKVASELVNSTRKKMDKAVLIRKQHVKD